jgi:ATP-binding cassette subfamily B protein
VKKLKLHKQEKSYSCLAACLRTVLDYYGIIETEAILRNKSQTRFFGTHPINAVSCARSYGLDAYVSSLTIEILRDLIKQDVPVITNILKFVDDEFYIHSVIVYKIENDSVYLMDPEDGKIQLSIKSFEALWQNNDCTAIVIQKPS